MGSGRGGGESSGEGREGGGSSGEREMFDAVELNLFHLVLVREWGRGEGSNKESKLFNAVGSEICHRVLMRDREGGSSGEKHKKNELKHCRWTHQKHAIFVIRIFFPLSL